MYADITHVHYMQGAVDLGGSECLHNLILMQKKKEPLSELLTCDLG